MTTDTIQFDDLQYDDANRQWEAWVEEGTTLLDLKDRVDWQLGDLVREVQASSYYGDKTLHKFALAINVSKRSLEERAQVNAFYEPWTRHLFDHIPDCVMRYSLWRYAMRWATHDLNDIPMAERLPFAIRKLEEWQANLTSPDDAYRQYANWRTEKQQQAEASPPDPEPKSAPRRVDAGLWYVSNGEVYVGGSLDARDIPDGTEVRILLEIS